MTRCALVLLTLCFALVGCASDEQAKSARSSRATTEPGAAPVATPSTTSKPAPGPTSGAPNAAGVPANCPIEVEGQCYQDRPAACAAVQCPEAFCSILETYPGQVACEAPSATDSKSGTNVSVGPDARSVRATNRAGDELWKVDVIATCGAPAVGQPVVRHIAIQKDSASLTFGKHSHASVTLADGKLVCQGSD